MFRFVIPTILVGVSIAGFFMFAKPLFSDISKIQSDSVSFSLALGNSKTLENERDKLTTKYNAIDPNNLSKLQKLLPDNIDNIRLILEIEKLALPYGMLLKNVKYDSTLSNNQNTASLTTSPNTSLPQVSNSLVVGESNKDYGTWVFEFSTEGSYSNFIDFIKELESNLRIVDISSIAFSSDTGSLLVGKSQSSSADSYKYDIKIKTYWLKN